MMLSFPFLNAKGTTEEITKQRQPIDLEGNFKL